MQDRFRFRVWNKNDKRMIYNAEIAYDGYNYDTSWQIGENDNDGWVDCFGYYLDHPKEYIVEQCTGLKDKNDKLIYEGDIILVDDDKCPVEWDFENARYNVVGYGEIAYLNYNDIEVIGNIHENAKLLEIN